MPLVQWKDEYSVGIDAVDYEHKQLIELINRLGEELAAENSKLTVPAFFGDLLRVFFRLLLTFAAAFPIGDIYRRYDESSTSLQGRQQTETLRIDHRR